MPKNVTINLSSSICSPSFQFAYIMYNVFCEILNQSISYNNRKVNKYSTKIYESLTDIAI